MARYSLSDIMRPAMSFEQQLCCEEFYNQVGNRIVNVEPLFYQGAILGTEFLVYDATKIYLCFELTASMSVPTNVTSYIAKRSLGNIIISTKVNTFTYYDPVIPSVMYFADTYKDLNVIFVRFTYRGYVDMKFNGYRVTIN